METEVAATPPPRRGHSIARLRYRDLSDVALSRARNGAGWGGLYTRFYAEGKRLLSVNPGIDELVVQRTIDEELLLGLHLFLIDRDVPHVYVSFRRMVTDPLYLYG